MIRFFIIVNGTKPISGKLQGIIKLTLDKNYSFCYETFKYLEKEYP